MSFITLSNSSKQIDDFFNMKEEHVDLFDNDEFALNDPFQEYYFGDWKKMDKINDNLIQSDDLHNTFNILQHEMGYLVCAPEIAQDSWAICKKNICICFDGLEKQNNELIRDFAAEYTDIRNNFWTNNDDDNINNFEKPQQNIKLKVPIVEFDYKFEEKNIGSTLNTSVKDFSAKSISWGKLRDEIKQESIEDESYDESQNLDMNIKSNKTKSKIDSNLFLVRRAWFRGFSEYYKNLFAKSNYSWQRKRGNKKKKTPMMTLIREFAESEFGDLISKLTESQWNKFRTTLFTILFSHRYKKGWWISQRNWFYSS